MATRLATVFGDWRSYNDLTLAALRGMSTDELALRAASDDPSSSTSWPIWAIAGHTAGTRAYWLCHVIGTPGAASTPFADPSGIGWEDDLGHPRSADELAMAWTTTWSVVESVLQSWTLNMLDEPVTRAGANGPEHFTRRSILMRLLTHEAYHVGEIAVIQSIHGRPQIDLWPSGYHSLEAPARGAG